MAPPLRFSSRRAKLVVLLVVVVVVLLLLLLLAVMLLVLQATCPPIGSSFESAGRSTPCLPMLVASLLRSRCCGGWKCRWEGWEEWEGVERAVG